jgi:hypothetical protein
MHLDVEGKSEPKRFLSKRGRSQINRLGFLLLWLLGLDYA